jgi:hypothetical protein
VMCLIVCWGWGVKVICVSCWCDVWWYYIIYYLIHILYSSFFLWSILSSSPIPPIPSLLLIYLPSLLSHPRQSIYLLIPFPIISFILYLSVLTYTYLYYLTQE